MLLNKLIYRHLDEQIYLILMYDLMISSRLVEKPLIDSFRRQKFSSCFVDRNFLPVTYDILGQDSSFSWKDSLGCWFQLQLDALYRMTNF